MEFRGGIGETVSKVEFGRMPPFPILEKSRTGRAHLPFIQRDDFHPMPRQEVEDVLLHARTDPAGDDQNRLEHRRDPHEQSLRPIRRAFISDALGSSK